MAAIAAVIKLKVAGLQPASCGQPEIVTLEEVSEFDATNNTLHTVNQPAPPISRMTLRIDKAGAQGAFKVGRSYKTEFTLIA